MRKSVIVGLVAAGAMSTSVAMTIPASAWDDCGRAYGYGYYGYDAPRVYTRVYSYAVAPVIYRPEYRPAYYYGAAYYRPAVWGWRSWGEPQWSYRAGWRRW
jgi:hypothetical protein